MARLPARGLIFGLILAAIAQFIGLLLAGAGHGWTSPLFVSVLLWILIPTTLLTVGRTGSGNRPLMLGVAAVALAADIWLVSKTIDEGRHLLGYIDVNGAVGLLIIFLWLGLWLFWQVLLLHALITARKGTRDTYD